MRTEIIIVASTGVPSAPGIFRRDPRKTCRSRRPIEEAT
jgi:hypothetical protein